MRPRRTHTSNKRNETPAAGRCLSRGNPASRVGVGKASWEISVAARLTVVYDPAARTNPRAPDDTRRTFVFYQTAARDVKQRVTAYGSNRGVPMPILVGNDHIRSAPLGQRRLRHRVHPARGGSWRLGAVQPTELVQAPLSRSGRPLR